MGQAIGEVLPLAVGVALSPLPIVAVVLMLVTVRAKVNGPAFISRVAGRAGRHRRDRARAGRTGGHDR